MSSAVAVRQRPEAGEILCPSCGEQNLARARFCIICGAATTVESGERRIVSVLFADARGFMDLAAAAPDTARAAADAITARLHAIVLGHGGIVDKVISENGLKVMAVFGAPVAHEDDPERAVRAAIAMREAAAAHAPAFAGLRLAIGIMTGEAIHAPIGPSAAYTVLGDTVNTAARLGSSAAAGEIVIGRPTRDAVEAAIDLVELPPVVAKGKVEPIAAWQVRDVAGAVRSRTRVRARLIGRDAELEALDSSWQRVQAERARRFVALIGDAGMGKTRLLGTFRRSARGRVFTGHCLPYGEGITYWPLVEIIGEAAGLLRDDPAATVSRKLGALLESLALEDLDQLRTIAVAVANLVAAPTTPRGTYQATEVSQAELHWGLRRLLELMALREPVAIVIEDLHWAEDTLVGFLTSLVDDPAPTPLMVIGTARPAFSDMVPPLLDPRMNRRVVDLAPLAPEDMAHLLREILGMAAAPELEPLVAAAAGNPLYLEELVRTLLDRGVIAPDGTPTQDLSMVAVPGSLHGLIESRLDQLTSEERAAASHASVVGRVFWSGAVEHVAGSDEGAALRGLVAREVIFPSSASTLAGQDEYAFVHIMLRDVTYGRIPKVERALMHERCGGWIASLPGATDEYVEFIAFHLEQACRLAQDVGGTGARPPTLAAVEALMRAARKAENREGTREADRFYERAFGILGEGYPETTTALRLHRADTRALLGDLEGATALLRMVEADAAALDRPDLRCRALLQLANLVATSSAAEARRLLDEADALANELDDERLRITRALASGFLRAIYEGAPEIAIPEMEEALDRAAAYGDPSLLIGAHQRLANLSMNTGRLERAEYHFRRSAEIARAEGSIRDETEATRFLATIAYLRGPRDEAERLARQALTWLERNPNRIVEVQTRSRLAWIAVARGDLESAEQELRAAYELATPIGGWMLVEILRNLTAVLCLQRRIDEAAAAADAAGSAVPDGDIYAAGVASLARAFVAAARRDEQAARAAFEHALTSIEGEPLDEGLAHLWFARALRSFGDAEGAARHAAAARAIYAAMDATAMLADLDATAGV